MRPGRLPLRSHALVVLAAWLLLLQGCVSAVRWDYEPQAQPGAIKARKPLKVAVLELGKDRARIDEVETGDWEFTVMLPSLGVPGFPWGMGMTNLEDPPSEPAPGTPAKPRVETTERLTHALVEELRATGAFARVDYAPPDLTDYDLVVKGALTDHHVEETIYFYCLPAVGSLVPWLLGLPFERWEEHGGVELEVVDFRGSPVLQLGAAAKRDFLMAFYYHTGEGDSAQEAATGVSRGVMADICRQVLGALDRALDDYAGDDIDRAVAARVKHTYHALDPELVEFERAIVEDAQGEGGTRPAIADATVRAYQLKVGLLETLRQLEERVSAEEQRAIDEGWQEYLDASYQAEREYAAVVNRQAVETLTDAFTFAAQGFAAAAAAAQARATLSPEAAQVQVTQATCELVQLQLRQDEQATRREAVYRQHGYELDAAYESRLEEALDAFRDIAGSREQIRREWLARYQRLTPSLSAVRRGRWPPPRPAASAAPPVVQGRVEITSQPTGADVYIGDEYFGTTPTSELAFPRGTRIELSVRLEGYLPFERSLTLRTANLIRINAVLEPDPSR